MKLGMLKIILHLPLILLTCMAGCEGQSKPSASAKQGTISDTKPVVWASGGGSGGDSDPAAETAREKKQQEEYCQQSTKPQRESCLARHGCKTVVIPPHMSPQRKAAVKVRPVDAATHHCESGKHWELGNYSTDSYEDTPRDTIECKDPREQDKMDSRGGGGLWIGGGMSSGSIADLYAREAIQAENDRYYWCMPNPEDWKKNPCLSVNSETGARTEVPCTGGTIW